MQCPELNATYRILVGVRMYVVQTLSVCYVRRLQTGQRGGGSQYSLEEIVSTHPEDTSVPSNCS